MKRKSGVYFFILLCLFFVVVNSQVFAKSKKKNDKNEKKTTKTFAEEFAELQSTGITLFNSEYECIFESQQDWNLIELSKSITEETIQKYGYDFGNVKTELENKQYGLLEEAGRGGRCLAHAHGSSNYYRFAILVCNAFSEQNGLEPVYVRTGSGDPIRSLMEVQRPSGWSCIGFQWNNNGYFLMPIDYYGNASSKNILDHIRNERDWYFITKLDQTFAKKIKDLNLDERELERNWIQYLRLYKGGEYTSPLDTVSVRLGRFTKN